MTSLKQNLINSSIAINKEVIVTDNTRLKIDCVGDVRLDVKDGENDTVLLKNVQYVPDLCTNLMSISQIIKHGNSVIFDNGKCKIFNDKRELVATASLHNNLFKLDRPAKCFQMSTVDKINKSGDILWHRRLGHLSVENMKRLKHISKDVNFSTINFDLCEICVKGKQTRVSFKHTGTRATKLLQIVHSDVCGPMNVKLLSGARYFVIFVDDFSRKVFLYVIKEKSEVFEKFVEFQTMVENQIDEKIKILRSDNGLEFVNKKMQNYLKAKGIKHQTTPPYTPEQNGLAERMNRSLVEKARCMLFDANLKSSFWAEAVSTAAYLVNRTPASGTSKTPEEIWSGRAPDLKLLKVFGCKAMVHIPKQKRHKFDPKSFECILLGYSEVSKAYRLYDLNKRSIVISRDVVFMENHIIDQVIESDNIDPKYFLYFEGNIDSTTAESKEEKTDAVQNNNGKSNDVVIQEISENEDFFSENESNMDLDDDLVNRNAEIIDINDLRYFRRSERIAKHVYPKFR